MDGGQLAVDKQGNLRPLVTARRSDTGHCPVGLSKDRIYNVVHVGFTVVRSSTADRDTIMHTLYSNGSLGNPAKISSRAVEFVSQCFQPFSGVLSEEGVYRRLSQETANYVSQLRDKVSQREVNLSTGLTGDLQRRIKLPEADLKLTIVQTAQLLENIYTTRVIPRLGGTEQQFWDGLDLEFRDWRGFAMKKLKEIFSPTFLVPLEDTDNFFQLKVNHLSVQRYADMLATVQFHDDLDIVLELHTPEGDINVQAPSLDVLYFDPNKQQSGTSAQTASFRRGRCSRQRRGQPVSNINKLEVPLPIPHPASIAVAIYNRENDQDPINLGDAGCQRVVRATQEVPYLHLTATHFPHHQRHARHSRSPELDTPDTPTPHTPDTPYSLGTESSTPASPSHNQPSTESVTLTSARLAVQEKSFSSEDGLSGLSDRAAALASGEGSSLGSILDQHGDMGGGGDRVEQAEALVKGEKDGDGEEGAQVLYYEVEKDTSCVLNMSDDGTPLGVSKSGGQRH